MQKEHIQAAIYEIEQSLAYELNIDLIARAAFISPAQLYRDFYSLTGHSVKEYIRKRRLSKALSLVKHSDLPLSQIALECGYSSQQAFCKCVKNAIGQTPVSYKEGDSHYFFPMFDRLQEHQIAVATETIPQTLCLRYYDSRLRGLENRAVHELLMLLPGYQGRIFGRNGKQAAGRFCYELFLEYDYAIIGTLKGSVFKGFDIIPETTAVYAKTTTKNIEDDINGAWDYLYTDWLKTSMFEQTDSYYFEEYIHKGGRIKRLVLHLPIKKCADYNRISLTHCGDLFFAVSRGTGLDDEERASKAVIGFLSNHHPYLMKMARQFYISQNGTEYACGVGIGKPLSLPEGGELENLLCAGGEYAVLEGVCCGDTTTYKRVLHAWIKENGFVNDGVPFTIYETAGGFAKENITTKVYQKVKR